MAEGVRSFVSDTASGGETEPFDAKTWEFIANRITHFAGDFTAPETYTRLAKLLEDTEAKNKTGGNVLFYLAVAEQLFGTIVERLGEAGLAKEKDGSWRRVIIEKPFGRDLATARALNARILKVLSEPQIFRMDHFLGKETVQNIMALRFSNAIFEPLWNRDHIDHVQITAAETVGVERRANFYEVDRRVARHGAEPCVPAVEPDRDGVAELVRRRRGAQREDQGPRSGPSAR